MLGLEAMSDGSQWSSGSRCSAVEPGAVGGKASGLCSVMLTPIMSAGTTGSPMVSSGFPGTE